MLGNLGSCNRTNKSLQGSFQLGARPPEPPPVLAICISFSKIGPPFLPQVYLLLFNIVVHQTFEQLKRSFKKTGFFERKIVKINNPDVTRSPNKVEAVNVRLKHLAVRLSVYVCRTNKHLTCLFACNIM